MVPTDSKSMRARGTFIRRAWEIAARIAAVMLALYLTLPLLASEGTFTGFDASLSATIAGALVVAAFGALAFVARRNRQLVAEVARLGERVEDLADRDWEL